MGLVIAAVAGVVVGVAFSNHIKAAWTKVKGFFVKKAVDSNTK